MKNEQLLFLETSNSSKSKPCERKTGLFPHEDPSQASF